MPAITSLDLSNAKLDVDHIAAIATSPNPTATDRLGVTKLTMAGVVEDLNATAAITATGINRAAAEAAATSAATSAGFASTAKTGAESARDAALIQAGVYVSEAAGRAAVADGVAFKVQGTGDTAAFEYRRTNSTTSVLIASYPSAGAVGSLSVFSGFDTSLMTPTTYGDATNPELDYTLLGSPIAATNFKFPEKGRLESVSFNVASSGNGEIHIYEFVSGTSYKCAYVIPVSFSTAGVQTFNVSGQNIICQKDGLIAYRPIVGKLNAQGTGRFYILNGYAGVGSTVTYGLTNTNDPAISYVLNSAEKGSLFNRIEEIEPRLNLAVGDIIALENAVGSLIKKGDASLTGGSYSSPNNTLVGSNLFSEDGILKSVSVGMSSIGNGEIRIYEEVTASSWICTYVIPVVCPVVGINTFSIDDGTLPVGISVKRKGQIGYKMIVGVQNATPNGTGAFHLMGNDAAGVGGINTYSFTGTNEPAISFSFKTTQGDSFVSKISNLENLFGGRFATFPGTKAYALGDSTIAATGYVEIINLIATSRVKVNVAVGGDTFDGQKDKWNALNVDPLFVGWVVIQLGLNDLLPSEAASVAIARLQDLVNTVRSKIGMRPLLIGKMLPCKQRLIDVYGLTNGPIAQQKWVDINNAIAGEGPTPITGVDYRIAEHVPLLDDGNGNLKAEYDSGDHIHENLAGRQIIATAWKKALLEISVVV